MTNILDLKKALHQRFHYTKDGWLDKWRILPVETSTNVFGDCEDYSLTLAHMDSDHSTVKMLWRMLTLKYVMWYVLSPRGESHAVLWVRGVGYTDNIMSDFHKKLPEDYVKLFPVPIPLVALKMLVGKIPN